MVGVWTPGRLLEAAPTGVTNDDGIDAPGLAALHRTIREAKAMGNSFFGILGGEPFMHKDLLKIFEENRDVYFQVFTNGHFITDEVAAELRKIGNATPLVSVEGTEIVSDVRRGRGDVLNQTMAGIEACVRIPVYWIDVMHGNVLG